MQTQIDYVTKDSFQKEVLGSKQLVLVDFYADWCAPCRSIAPFLNELAKKYQGQVEIKKVDIDENPELASEFGISSIPLLIFFNNSQEVKRIVGARPKDAIESELLSLLDFTKKKEKRK